MVELFANSGDPDQMLHSSDLGLHCLPVTGIGSLVFNGLKGKHLVSCDIFVFLQIVPFPINEDSF